MKKVINGCPYCGSKEGFEQKVVATYYMLYTADGVPDTATYEDDDKRYGCIQGACLADEE